MFSHIDFNFLANIILVCLLFINTAEYLEDICPYATFQLPTAATNVGGPAHKGAGLSSGGVAGVSDYGEATQSGLVYSGTYQPVQAAFVYHEPKQQQHQESYPLQHVSRKYIIDFNTYFLFITDRV